MAETEPRRGMPSPRIDRAEFRKRFLDQYRDPAFGAVHAALDAVEAVAWDAYENSRKSPRTRKAGPGYADPDYELAEDWLAAKAAIDAAQARYEDADAPRRLLLINAAARTEHTCPGEISKSYRLVQAAKDVLDSIPGYETNLLDLSRVVSEYGRLIHPCKTCFSTSAALCHWPCTCYPNYSLGQVHDWMNDIYPMWVEAHGILIVTPVNWYMASSPLKLMMDRLVCADGGNPDPTSTHGKKAREAKELELEGWPYERHLAGRLFSVIVHGDAEGVDTLRRSLSDWLGSMGLEPAGPMAEVGRYIGYYEPYATSHEALDRDAALFEEVRNAAHSLARAVGAKAAGHWAEPQAGLRDPHPK